MGEDDFGFGDLVEPSALSGRPAPSERDYPGGRPPVNRTGNVTPINPSVSAVWDDHPIRKLLGGREVEFFQLGALATALGREGVTIRMWEDKGKLPHTPFRSQAPSGPKGHLPGKAPKGRRLYTRAMIEGILRIANDEGVILNGLPPSERFFHRVKHLFANIYIAETQQGTPTP